MDFTGERYVPNLDSPEISYEHWHRYLYATQFVEGKVVLDIACGEGYGSDLLAKTAKKIIGVDIDKKTVEHAKKTYKRANLEFLEGSVSDIPVHGNAIFDVIVSFETIEHVSEIDQKKFMEEVKRLLKPNGVFICSTPDKKKYSDLPKYKNEFHLKEFYFDEFNQFLQKYFDKVKILGQQVYTSSNIWDLDSENKTFVEFNLKHDKNGFMPSSEHKNFLYLVAVCSCTKIPEPAYSVLTDVSNFILRQKDKRIIELQKEVDEFGKWGKGLDNEVELKNKRIIELQEEVERFGSWGKKLSHEVEIKEKNILDLHDFLKKSQAEKDSLSKVIEIKGKKLIEFKEDIQEKKEKIDELIHVIEEDKKKIDELIHVIEEDKKKIDELKKIEDSEENEIKQLYGEIGLLRDKSQFNEFELKRISDDLDAVKKSFSYKLGRGLTFPVRALVPPGTKREIALKISSYALKHPIRFARSVNPRNVKKFFWALKTENPDTICTNASNYIKNKKYLDQKLQLQSEKIQVFKYVDRNKKLIFEKNKDPLVSIVIPVYNQWDYTYECLFSILENTKDISYEIIIADDNSSDETKNIDKHVKNIIVARNEKNLGFLLNCNNAAKFAHGKYLLFLNNDTQVQREWLKYLVELIEKDEKIGLVGSKLVYPDGRLQEAGGIIWKDASGWNYGRLDDPEKSEYNYVKEVDYVSGASILVRKNLWDKIGGFDKRYVPAYFEDADLAFEIRKSGYKVMYQPKSVVVHFEGISHGTDVNSGLKSYQIKNKEKFMKKWKYILERHQFKNGEDVFLARDRSNGKKIILIIDDCVPTYDQHAGARMIYQYIKLFLKMGYVVKFMPDNFYRCEKYGEELEQMGVEIFYGNWFASNWNEFLVKNGKYFSVVFMNRAHISIKYIDEVKLNTKAKIVYLPADFSYLREMREYEITGKKSLLEQSKRSKKNEFYMFKNSDVVVTVSEYEKELLNKEMPNKEVHVIPVYLYDVDGLKAHEIVPFDKRSGLLFVGGFLHTPNVDAVLWFVKDIFPKILEKNPDIVFNVVGKNAPKEVLELTSKNVKICGHVSDEELEKLYQSVRVVVAPLRYGAGVKGKIVEAMWRGVPVVSTSIGLEGLYSIEEVISSFDDVENFANEVTYLCKNGDFWGKVCLNEVEYCKKHLSTSDVQSIVNNFFNNL